MPNQFGFEDFHIASKNSAAFKYVLTSHKLHYDPRIVTLQIEAPLHLASTRYIELTVPTGLPDKGVRETIVSRTSSRAFGSLAISEKQLSIVLFHANGVQQTSRSDVIYKRNVPNSGNLGSVEIFPIVLNVEDIESGIYHYDSVLHRLSLLNEGCFVDRLRDEILFQPEFSDAAVVLVLTSAIGRLAEKYGQRGYRLGLLDVGHVSQNLNLVSTSLDLNVCSTAGFIDDSIEMLLGIDGLQRCVLLMVAVGTRRAPDSR